MSDSEEVGATALNSAPARLLARGSEVDPLICPECGSRMKAIASIQDPDEIKHILRDLIKVDGAPLPGRVVRESCVTRGLRD